MRTFQRASRLIRPAVGLPVLMALAIVGLMVLALGCGDKRDVAPGEEKVRPLQDVPVPAGYKFKMDQSSERKMADGRRMIRHVYEVSPSVRETADFYRTSMPRSGWTLVEESLLAGRQRFQFDKASESCHVSIYDDWGTKVFIQIYPKGVRPTETRPAATPVPAPKSRPPIK